MKNVLLRPSYRRGMKIGPSSPNPTWFWRKGAFFAVGLKKKGRASSLSLRRNSTRFPCSGFVPDFVDGVDRRPHRCGADQVIQNADAVKRKAVLDLARAGADEVLSGRDTGGSLQARNHARRREREA